MKNKLKKQFKEYLGFTLVEILVYVAVLSIIILTVAGLFLWVSNSNNKSKAIRETMDNSKRALAIMTYEIRESDSVYLPNCVFDNDSGQLSLETKKYLPADETTSFIDFYICDNRLCLKKEQEDPVAITSEKVEIKRLSFSQINTTSTISSIQINLEIGYKTSSPRPEHRFSLNTTSTASLRSY
jgi:type II secretory pathway pseudopilin PulG